MSIKSMKQHQSCVRIEYVKDGEGAIPNATLPVLLASTILITAGAKVLWQKPVKDIRDGKVLGCSYIQQSPMHGSVILSVGAILDALAFPTGNYVFRRSTPSDKLLVQPVPNKVLMQEHLEHMYLQLLYLQQERSEVHFLLIDKGNPIPDPSWSGSVLVVPDAEQEAPAASAPAVPDNSANSAEIQKLQLELAAVRAYSARMDELIKQSAVEKQQLLTAKQKAEYVLTLETAKVTRLMRLMHLDAEKQARIQQLETTVEQLQTENMSLKKALQEAQRKPIEQPQQPPTPAPAEPKPVNPVNPEGTSNEIPRPSEGGMPPAPEFTPKPPEGWRVHIGALSDSEMKALGYTEGTSGYTAKEPFYHSAVGSFDANGFPMTEANEITYREE